MITRRRSIQRTAPPGKRRKGTRRGQASPAEVVAVREAVYERAGGVCELRLSQDCIAGILPKEGPVIGRGHLVHLKGKRMWGTSAEVCAWGCWFCHLVTMHRGGKPVPAKSKEIL
jgi:hypothetical protein